MDNSFNETLKRIETLERNIKDSWDSVTGSTNKLHLTEQAEKRRGWQAEIKRLKVEMELPELPPMEHPIMKRVGKCIEITENPDEQ